MRFALTMLCLLAAIIAPAQPVTQSELGWPTRSLNLPPLATDGLAISDKDATVDIQMIGFDAEGPVTYSISTQPTHGNLSNLDAVNGTVTYTPNNGYVGADVFNFRVTDSDGATDIAKVDVVILDSSTTGGGTPCVTNCVTLAGEPASTNVVYLSAHVPYPGCLSILPYHAYSPDYGLISTFCSLCSPLPPGATPPVVCPVVHVNGWFTNVFSGSGETTLCVNFCKSCPTNPVANNQSVSVSDYCGATNIQLSATPSSGLFYFLVSNPTNGTLGTLDSVSGQVTYTINQLGARNDSFRFAVSNACGSSSTGLVSVAITSTTNTIVTNVSVGGTIVSNLALNSFTRFISVTNLNGGADLFTITPTANTTNVLVTGIYQTTVSCTNGYVANFDIGTGGSGDYPPFPYTGPSSGSIAQTAFTVNVPINQVSSNTFTVNGRMISSCGTMSFSATLVEQRKNCP